MNLKLNLHPKSLAILAGFPGLRRGDLGRSRGTNFREKATPTTGFLAQTAKGDPQKSNVPLPTHGFFGIFELEFHAPLQPT